MDGHGNTASPRSRQATTRCLCSPSLSMPSRIPRARNATVSCSTSLDIRNVRTAHAAILDGHTLRAQTPRLLPMLQGCLRKHDPATRADDTMPRQVQFVGRHSQCQAGQPRTARQSGSACNCSISRYHPAGNHADHVPDRLNRRTVAGRSRASRRRSFGLLRQEQFCQ